MEMAKFAAKDLTTGQLNSIVRKLGGADVVRSILCGYAEVEVVPTPFLAPEMLTVFTRARTFVPKQAFETTQIYGCECQFHHHFLKSIVGAAEGKEVSFKDAGGSVSSGAYELGCARLERPIDPDWLLTALPEEIIFTDVDELLGRLVQFLHPESDSLHKRKRTDSLFYVRIKDELWWVTVWFHKDVWQFGASLADRSRKDGRDTHKKGSWLFVPSADPSELLKPRSL